MSQAGHGKSSGLDELKELLELLLPMPASLWNIEFLGNDIKPFTM